ncbi:MAG: PhzF family phenazine biosynthesis protein [Alphaproteobacteria bacterium]|nr:PhzF family phenazine biosynthesis protein [Alphaproteobacteria bacterium]
MTLSFETVDVFTDTSFGGNPLAVVFGAEGLTTERLQAIAREFNYSETTFVLPPQDPANTAQVRIFSTKREMPFAGHPNVGTAAVVGWRGKLFGKPIGDTVLFEEIAGTVPVSLEWAGGVVVATTLTAPEPFARGGDVPVAEVAACLGLTDADIRTDRHPPVIGSVGLPFILAELRDAEAVRCAGPVAARFADQPAVAANGAILCYARVDEPEVDIRARMFAPIRNVAEDPATGSACGALMGLLGTLEPGRGTLSRRIAQGVEMGRPSLLRGAVDHADGGAVAVRIGGRSIPVMRGTIEI